MTSPKAVPLADAKGNHHNTAAFSGLGVGAETSPEKSPWVPVSYLPHLVFDRYICFVVQAILSRQAWSIVAARVRGQTKCRLIVVVSDEKDPDGVNPSIDDKLKSRRVI